MKNFTINLKKMALFLLLICCANFTYAQDDVREEISTADDYSHYLETICDSVVYLKDAWANDLVRVNDNDHDFSGMRKPTAALMKFIKDKKHDVKNLGAIGKNGDAFKASCVQYLGAEGESVAKYFAPFVEIKGATAEADYARLSRELKQESEEEKELAETFDKAKEAYENENNLNGENAEE